MSGWIGVDPGARWTGIVARSDDDQVISYRVVDRVEVDPESKRVSMPYLKAVISAMDHVWALADWDVRFAVEDVVSPIGYEFIRPSDMIGLGMVLGWVLAHQPSALLVRPAKHGARPFHSYPEELSTPGERRYATRANTWGRPAPKSAAIRHARSAWDVAGAAPANARQQQGLSQL